MRHVVLIAAVLGLGGCAGQGSGLFRDGLLPDLRGKRNTVRPAARPQTDATVDTSPSLIGPPTDARTAEEFDTSTPEDRQIALAPNPAGDGRLGTTVASLGDPAETGFWIKTPLVSAPAPGRILYETSGRTVQVQLIPSGGPAGGGSQVSLAAMRLLDAPLTGLVDLVVFRN